MKIYDLAFLGLGASGLATLKLAYKDKSISIVGIDKNFNSSRNNFFAFWLTDWMKEFDELIKHRWHKWEFHYNEKIISHQSEKMPYCVIKFQDWKNFCINGVNNLTIKENDVIKLEKIDEFFEITLENGEKIYSKKIYDSRTPKQAPNKLKQHFLGHTIKSDELNYDNVVNLMDFRVSQDNGLHFIYILPFSKNELLIESTVFSKNVLDKSWYESMIEDYIQNILKIKKYQLIEEERGVLPMHSVHFQSIDMRHINIGSRGGATKISSGYAFAFFLKKLKSSKIDLIKNYHSFLDRWMDRIFVNFIENCVGSDFVFKGMVSSLSGNEFASFMMGTAGLKTKLKIILSMPKLSFIHSLFRSLSN